MSNHIKIAPSVHSDLLGKLAEMKKYHPQQDAPTKAAFILALFDPDSPQNPISTYELYNVVPAPLRHFLGAKDQLLDVDFTDQYPEGQKPLKSQQASATAHPETLAQLIHIPEIAEVKKQGNNLVKVGYVNQMPCPRCACSLAAGHVCTLAIDSSAFDAEWATRRDQEYINMSLKIMEESGTHMIEPQSEVPEWTTGKLPRHRLAGQEIYTNPLSVTEKADIIKGFNAHVQPFNKHTNYTATISIKSRDDFFAIGRQTLTPGIPEDEYFEKLKEQETKYSYTIPPGTALLFALQPHGIDPTEIEIEFDETPAMRDLINILGAGATHIKFPISHDLHHKMQESAEITFRTATHKSDHEEASKEKEYKIYNQLNALKVLKAALGTKLTLEVQPPTPKHDNNAAP
ncbi:MAG: hypothetical protein KTR28_07985 [Micavibrio sp.]|nr:hypothetical protein [Micavibrio sp.]